MAITTEQQTRVLQMTQAMFGAAPGATYLALFESSVAAGTSVAALAQSLSGTAVFFGSSYSASLTSAQFAEAFVTDLVGSHASTADKAWATGYIVDRMAAGATQAAIISELTQALSSVAPGNASWGVAATNYNTSIATRIVDNLVGSSASAADKTGAIDYIVSQLAAGQTVGNMVDWAISALDSVSHADGTWGNAATLLDNRVEVSRYYSVDKAGAATDLGTLQQALAAVTTSAASVATAKAMFDTPLSGRAQDGYLSGATVFVDLNGDGIHNPGETSVTTDAAGNFTLPAGAFGRIVASGGTDIATNLPFSGSFTAPAGSTVVNPLTTLVQSMVEQGSSISEAMAQVQTALGLSADIDLSTFDPIAEISGANASQAQAVLAAAVQVSNLFTMAASAMTGAEAGLSMETAFAQVVTALTAQITAATAPLDLADATMLEEVILASAGGNTALAETMADLNSDIAAMIADHNGTIADVIAAGGDSDDVLAQIMQVATVAQGDAATALLEAIAAGSTDLADILADYSGDAFAELVNNVDLGDVDGDGTIDLPVDLPGTTPTTPEEPAPAPVVLTVAATTDLRGENLSVYDALVVDDGDDANSITATLTAEQVDALAGNITKGGNDLVAVQDTIANIVGAEDLSDADAVYATVETDTDLTGEDLGIITSLTVDDGAATSITATLTAAQVDALVDNITKGGSDLVAVQDTVANICGAADLNDADQIWVYDTIDAILADETGVVAGADAVYATVETTTDLTGEDLEGITNLVVDDGTAGTITATLTAEQVDALGWNITKGKGDYVAIAGASGDLTGLSLSTADSISLEGDVSMTAGQLDNFTGAIDKGGEGEYAVELLVDSSSYLGYYDISEADSLVVDDGTVGAIIAALTAEQVDALAGNITKGGSDLVAVQDTIANIADGGLDLSDADQIVVYDTIANIGAAESLEFADQVVVYDSIDAILADETGVVVEADAVYATVETDTDLTGEDLGVITNLVVDDGTAGTITATLTAEQVDALGWNITKGTGDYVAIAGASGDLTGLSLSKAADSISLGGNASMTAGQLNYFAGAITKGEYAVELLVNSSSYLGYYDISEADSLVVDDGNDSESITATLTAAQVDALAGNITKGGSDLIAVQATIANIADGELDLSDADQIVVYDTIANIGAAESLEFADQVVVYDSIDAILADATGVVADADAVYATVETTTDLTEEDLGVITNLIVDDSDETSITATLTAEQVDALGWNITKGKGDYVAIAGASGDLTGLSLSTADSISLEGDVSMTAGQLDNFTGAIDKGGEGEYAVELLVNNSSYLGYYDISEADSLVVDDGNDTSITATLTAAQVGALGGNINKGENDLVAIAGASGNLTDLSLFMADSISLAGDVSMTAGQLNYLAGEITKNGYAVELLVNSSYDLNDDDISDADSLVVDDGDDANSITATLTAGQVDALAGNITKGGSDLVAVRDTVANIDVAVYLAIADRIDLLTPFAGWAIVEYAEAASAGVAAIDAQGFATFAADDDTLDDRYVAVEAAINEGGDAAAGQFAVFSDGATQYVFISDGVDGCDVSDGKDILVTLAGVNTMNASAIDGNTLSLTTA